MIVPTMQLALSAEVVSAYRHIKHQIGGSTTCFLEGYRLCLRQVNAPNGSLRPQSNSLGKLPRFAHCPVCF